jgi:hypothetical protein
MAMTGNHKAMATADTVFLKNRSDASNTPMSVYIKPGDGQEMCGDGVDAISMGRSDDLMIEAAEELCLTSNMKSIEDLHADDARIRLSIRDNVSALGSPYNPLHWARCYGWNPVVYTPSPHTLAAGTGGGWEKTIGTSLPPSPAQQPPPIPAYDDER